LNRTIGDTWKYATIRARKWELRQALLNHPEALRDLLDQYKAKPRDQYDFARDPAGEVIWHRIAQEFSDHYPLDIDAPTRPGAGDLLRAVLAIAEKYATLIEENGLWRHLYDDTGKLRHERFAQLLFYGIADSYCEANDLDLNREPNAGNGPVDFKLSSGYSARVNVEIKYTSNPGLLRGFRRQLPAYNSAERTCDSIYLVIRTTQSTKAIEEMARLREKALDRGEETPYLIVVDGRPRSSASRR
jgi:hypothetical protein